MNTDDYIKMMEANPPGAMSVPGKPSTNPYLKMMEDDEAENQTRFAASTNLAATTNPEEEARKKRIADLIGAPVSAVEGNPDLAKQLAAQKKLTDDTKDAPGLRKKYTDVDFTRLAHDQSAHLGIIERTLRNFAAGFGGDLAGSAVKGLGHTVNSIERFLIDGERFDPYTGESYNLYERTQKGEAPPLGQGLVDVGKTAKDYWQGLAPTDETTFSDMVVRGVGQLAGQLPMMAVSPGTGLAMMYGQGADQMMEKIEKDKTAQKASRTAQDIEVLSGGVITAATEWAASKLLLKPPQLLMLKNRLLNYSAKIALGGAEEGIQETLENIVQDFAHIVFTSPESKVAWDDALQSGEVGGIVGAIASSVINGALHIRARGVQKAFTNLSDATKAQQLRERDPGTYQDFSDAVTAHLSNAAGGTVENIYIDANTFYQEVSKAGLDPDEVAKLAPSISEQLDEAKITGGDIVIPLNEFAGKIAGTDLGDMLGQHLRSTPESPSLAELGAANKISGDIQKKAETIMKKQEEKKEFAKSANAVNKIIFDQIQSTGVYTTPVSRAYASMVRDFYVTRADELGVSPMEVYEAYPYKIVAGETGQQSAVMQSPLNTETPEFKNWFGDSKVLDETGKPLVVYQGRSKSDLNILQNPKGETWATNDKSTADLFSERGGRTYSLYMKLENPKIINIRDTVWNRDKEAFQIQLAKTEGHDGLIIQHGNRGEIKSDYVAFSPTQIKSVNNRGTFDPNDPNILNQQQSAVDKIIETAKANPEGFTIQVSDGTMRTTGFAVAPSKQTEVRLDALTDKSISDYLNTFKKVFENDNRAFLGGWYDSATNKFVLDVSYVVDSLEEALYLAENGAQDAIFNIDNLEEVRTENGISKLKQDGIYSEEKRDALRGVQKNLQDAIKRSGIDGKNLWQSGRGTNAALQTERGNAKNPISAVGVHYSNKERTQLESSHFGEGIRSAEAGRLAGQSDLQDRLYFYINTGRGISPEPALGPYAHTTTLNNLYDMTVDPENLTSVYNANDFERAVMRAGYDGYFDRNYGVAVLLGKRTIPVSPVNEVENIPEIEPPKYSIAQLLSQELRSNRNIPGGSITGPQWVSTLREDAPDLYAKLDEAGFIEPLKTYNERISRSEIPFVGPSSELLQRMAGQKRGGFDPSRLMTILTEKADYSTFLHETAHFFLSTYAEMASGPNATPRMAEDMQTLLKWFDVPDLNTWNSMSLDEQRKHHEAFAYNYELYVFDGKAPNIKMQGLFQRFSAWLKKVYTSIRGEINSIYKSEHGVDLPILTGEVRQVMDRMIASDKQIQQAEQIRGMSPIFATQEDANMTDEEWTAYQTTQQEARNEALEAHQAASLRQMKWLSNAKSRVLKAIQSETQEIRKWVTSEVAAEVNAQPIYRAKEFIKNSDEAESLALADALGFSSVEELKTAIANAPRKKDVIRQNVDSRMLEEYGEFTDPKAVADAVDQAVHNEARGKFIGVELRHLSKTQRPVRVMQEAAKQAARAILGKRAINTIKPATFTAAEAKASDAAEKAMKAGDTAAATQAKEHQLLQNQLASEAMKANAMIFKALDDFKKVFASDKRLSKSRDMNYVNTARAILAQYGVGTTEEPASFYLAKIKAYDPEFFAEVEPMITAHQLQAPSMTAKDPKSARPIDKLTLDEFTDLNDQISALWHLSRRNKQIEIDGKLMERTAVVEELNGQARSLNASHGRLGYNKAVTTWEEAKIKLMGMRASMRRVEAWVSAMDKGQTDGVFRRYIWNPVSESVVQYRMAKSDYMKKYIDILKDAGPLLKGPDIISPELNYTFKPQELLHALLHTGNISNKRKLLLGREWASLLEDGKTMDSSRWDSFINRLQNNGTLTKEHYDFAQKVWNLLEQMKPAAQKAHREMYGFYFNEVTATPFETPYGIYEGGYVPAVTDPTIVTEGAVRNEQETQSVDNSYMFPTTGRGFTKGRVEYNKPLLLNLGYIPAHMDKVLRFTHIEPRIKDVGRIVKTNKAFASTMDEFDPTARGDMLVPWLQRTAMQMVSMPSKGWGGKAADTAFRYLRVNTGFQMMIGNITNTLQQFTGISISALKVRPALLRNALWQYVKQPGDTAKMILEKSDYMKTRMNSDQYELMQTIDELLLGPNKYDKLQGFVKKHGYFMQMATQGVVDNITWTGAYNQAIEGNADEKEAVRQADAAVRMTQGSFAPEDVSRIETGSAFMRAFTHFYSYFNMQANILGTEFLNVSRNLGVKNGAGKLLYVYVFGFMIPAVLSEMIVQAAGGFDDGDDDEYDMWDAMRLFFSAQARPIAAMVPGIGPAAIATANVWNDKQYDDRLSTSPAVSTIESAVRAPHSVYKAIAEDGSWKRGAKDLLTLLGLITNLPLGQIGKPIGYMLDVEQGRTIPQSTGDYARGLLSGKDVNKK